jgi:hypothetical protein
LISVIVWLAGEPSHMTFHLGLYLVILPYILNLSLLLRMSDSWRWTSHHRVHHLTANLLVLILDRCYVSVLNFV